MHISAQDELLWALSFSLTALLLVILLWRTRWKQFPIFTSWIAFETFLSIALFTLYIHGAAKWYVRVDWTSLWPDFLLQLGVTIELARIVLCRRGTWVRGARGILLTAGIGGAAVAALLCWWINPPHGVYTSWELRADLFTSLVICELLVAISLIASWLGQGWPNEPLGIAEGLTAWSGVMTLTTALQAYLGSRYFVVVDRFRIYAWIGAMLWIATEFGLQHPAAEPPAPQPTESFSRVPKRVPPDRLRSLIGSLAAFQKQRQARLRPGAEPNVLPLPPAAHPIDGVQA